MLHARRRHPRLLACATDQARHDRMLDITGGDTAALTEITDAQDLLLRQEEPDLPALARLNVHRNFIADRNAHVPPICRRSGQPSATRPRRSAGPGDHRPGPAGAGAGRAGAGRRNGGPGPGAGAGGRAEAAARAIPDQGRRAEALETGADGGDRG